MLYLDSWDSTICPGAIFFGSITWTSELGWTVLSTEQKHLLKKDSTMEMEVKDSFLEGIIPVCWTDVPGIVDMIVYVVKIAENHLFGGHNEN